MNLRQLRQYIRTSIGDGSNQFTDSGGGTTAAPGAPPPPVPTAADISEIQKWVTEHPTDSGSRVGESVRVNSPGDSMHGSVGTVTQSHKGRNHTVTTSRKKTGTFHGSKLSSATPAIGSVVPGFTYPNGNKVPDGIQGPGGKVILPNGSFYYPKKSGAPTASHGATMPKGA